MGMDIYAEWPGMSAGDRDGQIKGFSAVAGDAGYLREAYHGGPYVTRYLVAEAFAAADAQATIPAKVLRARLPTAVLMHLYREQKLYGGGKDPSRIEAADLERALHAIAADEITDGSHDAFAAALTPESIETGERLIATGMLSKTAKAFVEFVELCERKERETGAPCTILASY
jgi:hypothetical protein